MTNNSVYKYSLLPSVPFLTQSTWKQDHQTLDASWEWIERGRWSFWSSIFLSISTGRHSPFLFRSSWLFQISFGSLCGLQEWMHGSARATLHHVSETRQCVHSFIGCTFGSYRSPACCCPSSHQTRPCPSPKWHVPGTIELSTIPHMQ